MYHSTYDRYDDSKKYLASIADPKERRRIASLGGKARAAKARRVHGKMAPNNPVQEFKPDRDSHARAGK